MLEDLNKPALDLLIEQQQPSTIETVTVPPIVVTQPPDPYNRTSKYYDADYD